MAETCIFYASIHTYCIYACTWRFFMGDFFSLLVVAIGFSESKVLYSSAHTHKSNIYISLAFASACVFVCLLLSPQPELATICLTDRLGTSLRYPVALVCCCITNDCGIFISIINLIYVAAAPAAFIVRIINAPQKSLLDPTRPGLQLPLAPCNLLFLYVPCVCAARTFYIM